eukprot:Pgem_evm1s18996
MKMVLVPNKLATTVKLNGKELKPLELVLETENPEDIRPVLEHIRLEYKEEYARELNATKNVDKTKNLRVKI